jgi:hypothetical protein
MFELGEILTGDLGRIFIIAPYAKARSKTDASWSGEAIPHECLKPSAWGMQSKGV